MNYSPEGEKRGPGRPRKDETRAVQTKRQRRRRDDLGDGRLRRLHVPEAAKDPKFEYRWINDTLGGRLTDKTEFDDWDRVTKEELVETTTRNRGDPYDAGKDTDAGEAVSRVVGTNPDGSPLRAYLCKKPKDWFEEDKGREQDAIRETEQAMERAAPPSDEGLHGDKAYIPSGVNTIRRET